MLQEQLEKMSHNKKDIDGEYKTGDRDETNRMVKLIILSLCKFLQLSHLTNFRCRLHFEIHTN